jgi:hypothetical protein
MIQETEPRPALITMFIALGICFVMMIAFGLGSVTDTLDPQVARGGVGAALGLILAITGNFVPKLRLFQLATGSPHSDAIDRFAGWIFVACGLSFAAVFLFAPADKIMLISPLIVLAGFLAVFARWLIWPGNQPIQLSPRWALGRWALAAMLVSVFSVSTIFFADAVWGDTVSRPMGIMFPFVFIVFAGKLRRHLQA